MSTSHAASPKRGWSGGQIDMVNASNASWFYNWWHTKPSGTENANAEWIPLLKYINANTPKNLDIIASYPDVDTLLVLNEPEREDQSNVSVADAIALWPTIEQVLPNHKLVSPAVSDNAHGQQWLSSFMSQAEAANLRVDAVAFHWYGGSTPNNVAGTAANFLNRVDAYHNTYGLPVWITEFAIHDWNGNYSDEQIRQANAQFLDIVIPALESRSYVERFAYYDHFSDANVFTGDPLTPTVVGDVLIGTLYSGDSFDLDGTSQGTDVFYLRGGQITNSGADVPAAMRAIDAIDSVSTLTGTNDWGIAGNSELRVRAGATLRKDGANRITFTNASTQNDGVIEVASGTLQFSGGHLQGDGAVRVRQNATLELLSLGGRENFLLVGPQVEVEGKVAGAVTLSGGSHLAVRNSTAAFDANVQVSNATINVGGDGFNEVVRSATIVTSGLQLNFDAELDPPGDSTWSNAAGSPADLQFAANVAPGAVNDATFAGVTAAYQMDDTGTAQGLSNYFEHLSPPRSRADATFEVVFHVAQTNAGDDQVLFEAGASRGISLMLSGDTLAFHVDGDGELLSLSESLSPGWHHAVGVIDLADPSDEMSGDAIKLYVNNQQVGTLSDVNIGDWAGGNVAGVGGPGGTVAGTSAPGGYHGGIAAARYYHDLAFSDEQVAQNYAAVTTPASQVATTMHIDGSLLLGTGAIVELDIADEAAADRIDVEQTLTITGGTLSVSYIGTAGLQAGDEFTLFDAAAIVGEFDDFDLHALDTGLMWNVTRMPIDGNLAVTLAGDYNGDGTVNLADYTVWRDTLGAAVSPLTAADGNGDGTIDAEDLAIWRSNFGLQATSVTPASNVAVPEPGTWLLLSLGVFLLRLQRKRGR